MKHGVRNGIAATVKSVKKGNVMAQVEYTVEDIKELTSVLTVDSAEDLDLKPGDKVKLLVKAINIVTVKE